jgi:hypothetical protein
VKGVGPITSLAYVLTLENPDRFVKSRDVGPYLGLVPKQEDSGESQPQLGISKTGDTMLRKLLVGSAHYILGPFGPDTDLRRYGLRLCERGGKNAKKRAAVAVARKLAILLHCLWVSGEAVTWKSVEVTVWRRRSRPDLISHDEYPRSYSGKATTCRKRSDNVPAIERSASKPRGDDVSASIEAVRAQG